MKLQSQHSTRLPGVVITFLFLTGLAISAIAQKPIVRFGKEINSNNPTADGKKKDTSIQWIEVNTPPETWTLKNGELICAGKPIGVMRSEKQYENFILHVEWKHMEPGGNSGIFVWSAARPDEKSRLPDGVEVQMLELDWVKLNTRDGNTPPIAYVHGELFGVGGVETVPDNPRGTRSKSIENLIGRYAPLIREPWSHLERRSEDRRILIASCIPCHPDPVSGSTSSRLPT